MGRLKIFLKLCLGELANISDMKVRQEGNRFCPEARGCREGGGPNNAYTCK
jgi:hypothetical protein